MTPKEIAEEIRDFWAQEGYQEFPVSAVAVAIARAEAEQYDACVEAVKRRIPLFGPEGPNTREDASYAVGMTDALAELRTTNPRSLKVVVGPPKNE